MPLLLDDAVRISGKMLALFSCAGVPVIRMGLQPTEEIAFGSDTLLAGPFHPAFGYLVRCFLKREQMAMLLREHSETSLRFLGPKKDLPLLFGDHGETLGLLAGERKLVVGESDLPRGAVALAPFSKKEKGNLLGILTEEDFLKKYTDNLLIFFFGFCGKRSRNTELCKRNSRINSRAADVFSVKARLA